MPANDEIKPMDRQLQASICTQLNEQNTIGRGASGAIYRVNVGKEDFKAVKILSRDSREVETLRSLLKHTPLPRGILTGELFAVDEATCWLISECCPFNLKRFLSTHSLSNEQQNVLYEMVFTDLVSALGFLAKNDIIHNDIKLENIVWSPETKEWKLIDFGASKTPRNGTHMEYTPGYCAPERIDMALPIDIRSDIYSLGIVLSAIVNFDGFKKDEQSWAYNQMANLKNLGESLKKSIKMRESNKQSVQSIAWQVLELEWLTFVFSNFKDSSSRFIKMLSISMSTVLPDHRPQLNKLLWMAYYISFKVHQRREKAINYLDPLFRNTIPYLSDNEPKNNMVASDAFTINSEVEMNPSNATEQDYIQAMWKIIGYEEINRSKIMEEHYRTLNELIPENVSPPLNRNAFFTPKTLQPSSPPTDSKYAYPPPFSLENLALNWV